MKSHGLTEFDRIRRRLLNAVAALVGVTAVGIAGFAWIGRGRHDLLDAVYMTVITLSTVGYGEVIDLRNDAAARLFTVFLILVGMGIVAYAVPQVASFAIEGQLSHVFARRRMQKAIARLNGHHIVCGDSTAAWHVAEELVRSRRDVALVVPGDQALAEAQERLGDVPAVVGDAAEDPVLSAAGADRAAGIVACLSSDKDNVLAVLTARRLAPRTRIVAATFSEHPGTEEKLRAVGADAVVSPSRIGGLRMASELVRPRVVSFLDRMLRDERALRVEEVPVPPGSRAARRPIEELGLDTEPGVLLLALKRPGDESFEFKPSLHTVLEEGMTLVVMVDPETKARIEDRVRA